MKQLSRGSLALLSATATTAVYVTMMVGPLDRLSELGRGPPFDMRPSGYGLADARQLLLNLGSTGRYYYLTRQLPLDALYPALLATTIILALRWSAWRFGQAPGQALIAALAIAAAAFDYVENVLIFEMLVDGPTIAPRVVAAASAATIAKSVATTFALIGVIYFILISVRRRRSR